MGARWQGLARKNGGRDGVEARRRCGWRRGCEYAVRRAICGVDRVWRVWLEVPRERLPWWLPAGGLCASRPAGMRALALVLLRQEAISFGYVTSGSACLMPKRRCCSPPACTTALLTAHSLNSFLCLCLLQLHSLYPHNHHFHSHGILRLDHARRHGLRPGARRACSQEVRLTYVCLSPQSSCGSVSGTNALTSF